MDVLYIDECTIDRWMYYRGMYILYIDGCTIDRWMYYR